MEPGEPSTSRPGDTAKGAVSRLHQAVIAGDISLVRELLDQDENNIDTIDEGGRTALHVAVEHAQLALVHLLLDHGADIEAPNSSGRTALHEAVVRNDVGLTRSLLEHGADVEATTPEGEKPLWMAAKKGHEPVAELLLQCKADVESFNERTWTTALFEAVNQGREGLVKLLIENGADIDARQTGPPAARKGGASRTLSEVSQKKQRYKLQVTTRGVPQDWARGPVPPRKVQLEADREIPLHRAVISGNADMAKLLLQHGANMAIRGKDGRSAQQIAEEQGARELAALLSSALLQQGPEITKEKGKRPHDAPPPIVPRALPAPRHNPDKMHACRCWEATMIEFYTEGREQRYQQSASIYDLLYGKGPKAVLDAKRPGRVVGETAKFTWYHLPANNMEWVEALVARLFPPQNPDRTTEERLRETLGIIRPVRGKAERASPTPRPSFKRPDAKEIKEDTMSELGAASSRGDSSVVAFIPYLHFESSMHHDLVAVLMNDRSPPEPMPLPREQSRAGTTLTNPSTLPQSADPEATHSVPLGSGVSGTHQDHVQHPDESSRAGGPEQPLVQRAQEEPPPDQSQPPTLRVIDAIHPYVHLIKGYFSQEKPGDVPRWQPRRSLDGYFYTHLADIRRRDGDQVILRYTTNNCPPARIFVVDQLWVWILGSETIITCSPLTYDSWIWDAHGQATRSGNMRVVAPEDPMNLHQNIIRHLKRGDREPITSVHDLACLIADTCTKLFDQDETPDGFRFFDFFEHEIARLSEMAMLQLEEFKKSLGSARHSNQSGSKHIRKELSLLVEVHDICDELEILEKVLKDQDDALTRMKGILAPKSRWEWTGSWATGLHAQWLHRMLKMATRTRETLYHLLDLKLKQASFYEAMDTRKQAEATKQQTRLATEHSKVMAQQTQVAAEHSEVMAQQLETMKDQALETGRQGQTLLVFTVVTIIFLPSSFMAAVFSIDLDTFPVDGNDKMPLGYFLKYLFAISCAITIPLVVLAFNLTPMVAWWSRTRQRLIRLWPKDSRILWTGVIGPAIALAVEGAVVGAIWAAPLAVSIKAAVTISISLLVALAIGVLVLYAVNSITKRHRRSLQTGSGSSYVGSMLGDTRDILVVEEQREAADFEHRQH